MKETTDSIARAFDEAARVRERAYSPYSGFQVGVALKVKNESELITGCNVENASYGATICAERSAVLNWVAKHGAKKPLEFLVLVTRTADATPCGVCLQVLSEFCQADFPIYIADPEGIKHERVLSDFLPLPFAKTSLA